MRAYRIPAETDKAIKARAKLDKVSEAQVIAESVGIIDQVYVMKNMKNGLFKIGRSKNPCARQKTLQSEDPEIVLISATPAAKWVERALHKVFSEKRVRGEWFKLSEDEAAKITDMVINGMDKLFAVMTNDGKEINPRPARTTAFSRKLKSLVSKVGGPVPAGIFIGMSPQIIRFWIRGKTVPGRATKVGAIELLRRAARGEPLTETIEYES